MPAIGFKCPKENMEVPFEYCANKCECPCMSSPLLTQVIGEPKDRAPNSFHVTEIPTPEQIIYLKRTNLYYTSPFDKIWMVMGSGVHSLLEESAKTLDPERYEIEKEFMVDFGYATIKGRPDLYDRLRRDLLDYKTGKGYKASLLKQGVWEEKDSYLWQMNIYKLLAYPEAQSLTLEYIVKDWSIDMGIEFGIQPVEQIVVPIIPQAKAETIMQTWLQKHLTNINGDTQPAPCTQSDVWFNFNKRSKNFMVPVRCKYYCEVSHLCPQFAQYKKEESYAEKARVYPKR